MRQRDWFTGIRLARLPDADKISALAADVAAYWASQGVSPFDAATVFRLLGWKVRVRSLKSARCQHRAMLVPMLSGGFTVLVDPAIAQVAGGGISDLMPTVLVHEFAHSFFYAASEPPERLMPLHPDEEVFCDTFAAELLKQQANTQPRAVVASVRPARPSAAVCAECDDAEVGPDGRATRDTAVGHRP